MAVLCLLLVVGVREDVDVAMGSYVSTRQGDSCMRLAVNQELLLVLLELYDEV
jgi:hypothetical protein